MIGHELIVWNDSLVTGVTEIDTVGAWVVWSMARDHDAPIAHASEQAERTLC